MRSSVIHVLDMMMYVHVQVLMTIFVAGWRSSSHSNINCSICYSSKLLDCSRRGIMLDESYLGRKS